MREMVAGLKETLRKLTREELEEIMGVVTELLEEKEVKETQGEKEKRVHYEVKMIPRRGKLYGPFLYARWWENGKHKAKYLGKVTVV